MVLKSFSQVVILHYWVRLNDDHEKQIEYNLNNLNRY